MKSPVEQESELASPPSKRQAVLLSDEFTEWLGLVYIKRFLFLRHPGLCEYVYPKESSYRMTFPTNMGAHRASASAAPTSS